MASPVAAEIRTFARPNIMLTRPPPQKRAPTTPLPSRPQMSPLSPLSGGASLAHGYVSKPAQLKRPSVIVSWATHVQPGSPALPSPPSTAGTPALAQKFMALSRLRSPESAVVHAAGQSMSFLRLESPTLVGPLLKHFKSEFSITARSPQPKQPKGPRASPKAAQKSAPVRAPLPTPSPTPSPSSSARSGGLRTFQTAAAKKLRAHSASPKSRRRSRVAQSPGIRASRLAIQKRTEYSQPLASERLMLTLVDGPADGKTRRLTMDRSSVAAAVAKPEQDNAPRELFEEDEEWEFARLIMDYEESEEWEDFNSTPQSSPDKSVYSQESALDPRYQLSNPWEHTSQATSPDSGGASTGKSTPGLSVLAIPARSRRRAAHLRKASYFDAEAFTVPLSPASPLSPQRVQLTRSKGATRRRPAPLALPLPGSNTKIPSNSPADARLARIAFLEESYHAPALDVGAFPTRPVAPLTPPEDSPIRPRKAAMRPPKLSLGSMKDMIRAMSSGTRTHSSRSGYSTGRSSGADGEDILVGRRF
ncbi:hypothetical protein OF83DRAFT_193575 [Amylostereum chailletii]|nr:hypothetical protein OF83DRAFT_193575 [Amylostereum chailletii]